MVDPVYSTFVVVIRCQHKLHKRQTAVFKPQTSCSVLSVCLTRKGVRKRERELKGGTCREREVVVLKVE